MALTIINSKKFEHCVLFKIYLIHNDKGISDNQNIYKNTINYFLTIFVYYTS